MKVKRLLIICIMIGLSLLATMAVYGQDSQNQVIDFGGNILGEVSLEQTASYYTFEGVENQEVSIRISSATIGFVPFLQLIDSNGSLVAEDMNPDSSLVAGIDVILFEAGQYQLVVSSANESAGRFVLQLHSINRLELGDDDITFVDEEQPSREYFFTGNELCAIWLSVISEDVVFGPSVEIFDVTNNQLFGTFTLPSSGAQFRIPPGINEYRVDVNHAGAEETHNFEVRLMPDCAELNTSVNQLLLGETQNLTLGLGNFLHSFVIDGTQLDNGVINIEVNNPDDLDSDDVNLIGVVIDLTTGEELLVIDLDLNINLITLPEIDGDISLDILVTGDLPIVGVDLDISLDGDISISDDLSVGVDVDVDANLDSDDGIIPTCLAYIDTEASVNVYDNPTTSSNSVLDLSLGDAVNITAISDDGTLVQVDAGNGQAGWVSSSLILQAGDCITTPLVNLEDILLDLGVDPEDLINVDFIDPVLSVDLSDIDVLDVIVGDNGGLDVDFGGDDILDVNVGEDGGLDVDLGNSDILDVTLDEDGLDIDLVDEGVLDVDVTEDGGLDVDLGDADILDVNINDDGSLDVDVVDSNILDVDVTEDGGLDVDLAGDDILDVNINDDGDLDVDLGGEDALDMVIGEDGSLGIDLGDTGILDVNLDEDGGLDVDFADSNLLDVDVAEDGGLDVDIVDNDFLDVDISDDSGLNVDVITDDVLDIDATEDGGLDVDFGGDDILDVNVGEDGGLDVDLGNSDILDVTLDEDGLDIDLVDEGVLDVDVTEDGGLDVDLGDADILDVNINDDGSLDVDVVDSNILDVDVTEDGGLDVDLAGDDILDVNINEDGDLDVDLGGEDALDMVIGEDGSLGIDLGDTGILDVNLDEDGALDVDFADSNLLDVHVGEDGGLDVDIVDNDFLDVRVDDGLLVELDSDDIVDISSETLTLDLDGDITFANLDLGDLECAALAVNLAGVNVRSAPNANASIVGILTADIAIEITGALANGAWVQVTLENGQIGWVAISVINIAGPACDIVSIIDAPIVDVNVDDGGVDVDLGDTDITDVNIGDDDVDVNVGGDGGVDVNVGDDGVDVNVGDDDGGIDIDIDEDGIDLGLGD